MGCNCGKPKPGPLGGQQSGGSTSSSSTQSGESGGLSSRTQSFSLQLGSSAPVSFTGSMLEAQAQAVRMGGATVRPL